MEPPDRQDRGERRLRVDLHLHSRYSFDSGTPLEALIARCREAGLDRIALTDHNTATGALELKRLAPELCIVGEEVKTSEGEVVGLFLNASIGGNRHPEDAFDLIHGMGGLTYIAHPFDRRRASWRPERLLELRDRIDIIETYNPWCQPGANQAAADFCRELGKVAATGSDAHSTAELGLSWMEIEPYTTPGEFLERLRGAEHVITSLSGTRRRS